MTDWSQSGEQAMVEAWAERRGPGRFLDIGAADGVTASNTRWLADQGWAGVAVEPAPRYFDELANLYAGRDDIECVQIAVRATDPGKDHAGLTRFYLSDDLISTTDEKHVEIWSEVSTFKKVTVGIVDLELLLCYFPGPYDLVSIDTEGTSMALWNELRRADAFAPGSLVVIEAEDGGERWDIQQACLDGWERVGVTPNNVLLSTPLGTL